MNHIKAISGLSPHMGKKEHLSIYIDGKRLDEILSQKVKEDYLGLIPAWLNFYDKASASDMKTKSYVWRQTKLSDKPVILPILLCPDDFDFSCTVIVVEVVCMKDKVIWHRFGVDNTQFDVNETELPQYIGKKIDWFDNIGSSEFSKEEYLSCVSLFSDVDS